MLSCTADGVVLWNAASGGDIAKLDCGECRRVVHHNGRWSVAARRAVLHLSHVDGTLEEVGRAAHPDAVWCVAEVAPGTMVTGCGDGQVRWFQGDASLASVDVVDVVWEVCSYADGHRVACSAGTICSIADRRDGSVVQELAHDNDVLGVSVSPCQLLLATAGWDKCVRVFDVRRVW